MSRYEIAVTPGDGIGEEVVSASVELLAGSVERVGGFRLQTAHCDWRSERYPKTDARCRTTA